MITEFPQNLHHLKGKLLYKSRRSLILHLLSVMTLSLFVYVIYLIFSDLSGFMEAFGSVSSAIFVMIIFIVLGSAMFIALCWLSGRYVLTIVRVENEKEFIQVKTWSVLGFYKTRKYHRNILKKYAYFRGESAYYEAPSVKAPWFRLKTPNGKWLVVDARGEFYK